MQMTGFMGSFYRISEWIMRLAIINLLWILFTLVGLVVFGVVPATIALFTVIRKWLLKEPDIPIFKTFVNAFKKDFIKGNLLGLILGALAYIIYIDYQYLLIIENPIFYSILFVGLVFISIAYSVLLFNIFPVYVHFDIKFMQHIKYAILIGIMNLHITISMFGCLYLVYLLNIYIPGIIPFFSVSLAGFVCMFFGNLAFKRLEAKQQKILEKEALARQA
ncbi:hypothetical protein BTS2_0729 [Bacillus sp. TS-2]|nr:hypothetical protein BTS2_0729 [Bacillus sp. TS-2]